MSESNNVGEPPSEGFILSNKLYNRVKWVAMVLIPALSTFYFTLGGVWKDLPYVTEVIGTLAAIDVFLGVILGLSTRAYNSSNAKYDGSMDVEINDQGNKMFTLSLNKDPELLENLSEVTFKVIPSSVKQ